MTVTIQLPDDHPLELISEDDRQWFDDYPGRVFRLRFATDGDVGLAGTGELVLVFCPKDGIRLRIPCRLTTMPLSRARELVDFGTDAELSYLFTALTMVDGPDGGPLAKGQRDMYEACRKK